MEKQWYLSKTFIVNTLALIFLLIQQGTGFIIKPEEQASILVLINLALRVFTGEPISFGKKSFFKGK